MGEGPVRALLLDQRFFNFLIMALYALNACRWAVDGKWADCLYWIGALWITSCVTFGYSR